MCGQVSERSTASGSGWLFLPCGDASISSSWFATCPDLTAGAAPYLSLSSPFRPLVVNGGARQNVGVGLWAPACMMSDVKTEHAHTQELPLTPGFKIYR